MGKIAFILLLALAAALAMTNPNQEAHKQVVYAKMASDRGVGATVSRLAGEMLGDLDPMDCQYHNYVVFSTLTHKEQVVSVGMLNRVWEKR